MASRDDVPCETWGADGEAGEMPDQRAQPVPAFCMKIRAGPRVTITCFISISSLILETMRLELSTFAFYKWETWGSETLSKLQRVYTKRQIDPKQP